MEIKYSPSKNLDKRAWLDYLYYKEGKQQINFFLCGTYGKPEEKNFTKWRTYLDCVGSLDDINGNEKWEDRKFFESINQRQIFPNEIVLDIEDPKELNPVINRIMGWGLDLDYFVFRTGSRGFHIHIFLDRPMATIEKEFIVKTLGTDIQKCSEKNLIALENCPHWKTGKLKSEVAK